MDKGKSFHTRSEE